MKYTSDYYNKLSKTKLLSAEEEIDLSKRVMNGEKLAIDTLVKNNLKLVISIAKKYPHSGDFDDLVQEGNLGLIRAAEKYDYRKEVRFSTYSTLWIKQAITKYFQNKKRMIRIPIRKYEELSKIIKYKEELESNQQVASIDKIALRFKMKEEEVINLLNVNSNVSSVDHQPQDGSSEFSILGLIPDNNFSPEVDLDKENLKYRINNLLSILEEKESLILKYRNSYFSEERLTLKEVAEKLSISTETVRQIEMKAIKKIKAHSKNIGFFEYNN